LSRTSSKLWELFLVSLDKSGQQRLANMIRGKQIEDLPGFTYYNKMLLILYF
jgi:hypothetical protein